MPPKAKTSQPSKKTVEKKKEKIIEVRIINQHTVCDRKFTRTVWVKNMRDPRALFHMRINFYALQRCKNSDFKKLSVIQYG